MPRGFDFGACLVLAVGCLLFASVVADVYMHNPRGSNDRFNENSDERQNGNRMFDSQNNAKGGYNIGERNPDGTLAIQRMTYYGGSKLLIEWTNQHGCGVNQPKTHCEIVLQYACDSGAKEYNGANWDLSDGTETGTAANPPATGINDPQDWYTKCTKRDRNKGLYIADRTLNGDSAKYTRQNNNGDQHGTECPEERDYYPYWHPTVWKDIAILTSNPSRCPYYQAESQNVKARGECECKGWATKIFEQRTGCPSTTPCWKYNNANNCSADTQCEWVIKGHSNVTYPRSSIEGTIGAPDCQPAAYSRDNHLGNGLDGETLHYEWTVPDPMLACGSSVCQACVLRMRYNITTNDYGNLTDWQFTTDTNATLPSYASYFDVDSRLNGRLRIKMDNVSNYFRNDPVVDTNVNNHGLALALNTAQTGRVFQDRSHSFEIDGWPDNVPKSSTIYNLNVRGKRGNIVQVYPAVEYDFVPTTLNVKTNDYVHFQWVGSNSNPPNNAGQGRAGTDRNNLLQIGRMDLNFPLPLQQMTLLKNDTDLITAFATSGFGPGVDQELDTASPYFNYSPIKMDTPGTYYYMCSRNNNFSNRSQKASIIVSNP